MDLDPHLQRIAIIYVLDHLSLIIVQLAQIRIERNHCIGCSKIERIIDPPVDLLEMEGQEWLDMEQNMRTSRTLREGWNSPCNV
jgi:hypothetical protein